MVLRIGQQLPATATLCIKKAHLWINGTLVSWDKMYSKANHGLEPTEMYWKEIRRLPFLSAIISFFCTHIFYSCRCTWNVLKVQKRLKFIIYCMYVYIKLNINNIKISKKFIHFLRAVLNYQRKYIGTVACRISFKLSCQWTFFYVFRRSQLAMIRSKMWNLNSGRILLILPVLISISSFAFGNGSVEKKKMKLDKWKNNWAILPAM